MYCIYMHINKYNILMRTFILCFYYDFDICLFLFCKKFNYTYLLKY